VFRGANNTQAALTRRETLQCPTRQVPAEREEGLRPTLVPRQLDRKPDDSHRLRPPAPNARFHGRLCRAARESTISLRRPAAPPRPARPPGTATAENRRLRTSSRPSTLRRCPRSCRRENRYIAASSPSHKGLRTRARPQICSRHIRLVPTNQRSPRLAPGPAPIARSTFAGRLGQLDSKGPLAPLAPPSRQDTRRNGACCTRREAQLGSCTYLTGTPTQSNKRRSWPLTARWNKQRIASLPLDTLRDRRAKSTPRELPRRGSHRQWTQTRSRCRHRARSRCDGPGTSASFRHIRRTERSGPRGRLHGCSKRLGARSPSGTDGLRQRAQKG
jgi:hypothetical protein